MITAILLVPNIVLDASATSRSTDVLVYGYSNSAAEGAFNSDRVSFLESKGYNVETRSSYTNSAEISDARLVIIGSLTNPGDGSMEAALQNYVSDGGRLILLVDTAYQYCNPEDPIDRKCVFNFTEEAFGFKFDGSVQYSTVYPAPDQSSHPIWTTPNRITEFTDWCCDAYVSEIIDTDNITVLSTVSGQSYKPSGYYPVNDVAAIVVNEDPAFNGGKVIGAGYNMVIGWTTPDLRLLENMVEFMLSDESHRITSPLQQTRDGVPLNEIMCSDDLILMQSQSGSPACVFAKSVKALLERGFALEDETTFDFSDMIDVGVMLPATGDLGGGYQGTGGDIEFAIYDFNSYLKETGATWRFSAVLEDTQSDRTVALEKIQSLNSKGIKLVIGPLSSTEIHHIKSYVDSNDMVLISPTSTSPDLAAVDNIFRMVPDYSQQGKVLALLFQEHGINAVIPIYRDGVWGDDLYESAKSNFESLGGVMDEGVRYSPEGYKYPEEANLLSRLVAEYTDEYSANEVAVLLIGFSEAAHILNSADSHDNLREIRWFGSEGSSNDEGTLTNDPVAAAFMEDVSFVSTQFTTSTNDVYLHVMNHFVDRYYEKPDTYVYSLYDSVFVLGKAILATNSTDPLIVSNALTDVAATHTGATGAINLNEFGDLAVSDYGLWTIQDGKWIEYGRFNSEHNTFDYHIADKIRDDDSWFFTRH